jgi:hypothetical protein
MVQYFPVVTGSLTVTGSINVSGGITASGGISISGSIASASFASTASFVALAQSASNAVAAATASFANAFTVAGNLTAQTLVVQTITSSVDFVTGSTRFGSILGNTHLFTGSVSMTGSLAVVTNGTEFQVTSTGVNFGNALTDSHIISGSLTINPNGLFVSSSGNVGIGTITPGTRLEVFSTAPSGDRTIPHNVLTITAEQGNAPYGFFGGAILFKNRSYTSGLVESSRIRSVIYDDGAPSNFGGGLWFETTPTPGGALTSSLVINYLGRVGIGTTTPNYPLHVYRSSGISTINVESVSGQNSQFRMEEAGAVKFAITYVPADSTARIFFAGHGSDLISLKSSNVGIGTVSPLCRLHVGPEGSVGGQTPTILMSSAAGTKPVMLITEYTARSGAFGYDSSNFLTLATEVSVTAGIKFKVGSSFSSGLVNTGTDAMTIASSGAVTIPGSLSKGSGSFRIKHPLPSKKDTHQLVHSFIEGPQADLIYSGGVTLVDGKATINIDKVATMTEGTFEALCRNIRVFTSNETSWDNVRGKVEGNILTIECQNTESTDEVSWLVIGERQDEHMFETEWTDENGKVIVEPVITELE